MVFQALLILGTGKAALVGPAPRAAFPRLLRGRGLSLERAAAVGLASLPDSVHGSDCAQQNRVLSLGRLQFNWDQHQERTGRRPGDPALTKLVLGTLTAVFHGLT